MFHNSDIRLIVIILILQVIHSRPDAVWNITSKAGIAEGDRVVEAGKSLQLTCSLTSAEYLGNMSFAIKRTGLPDTEVPEEFYKRLDDITLRLVMPNVSVEFDGSRFCCMLDNRCACYSLVTIREFPKDVQLRAVADYIYNMTVDWCTEQKDVNYTAQYKVYGAAGRYSRQPTVYFENETNRCWSLTIDMLTMSRRITFFVSGTNLIGTRTSNLSVDNPSQYVKLRPVQQLRVSFVSSDQVSVSWIPYRLGLALDLEYIVECFTDNDTTLTQPIACTFTEEELQQTNFTGLKPFTPYTISVRTRVCVDGGGIYWSDVSAVHFRTSEDAPSAAPRVLPGWFRYKCPQDGSASQCPVQVFWQPIPATQRNGVLLGYEIFEDGQEVETSNINGIDVISATVDARYCGIRRMAIRAFNSVGYSPPAFVYISSTNSSIWERFSEIYVETTDRRHQVIVHWSLVDGSDIDNFTVFYCKGFTSCDEEPRGFVVPGQSRNATVEGIIDPDRWLYSVSGNWEHGSTGLTCQWIRCVYRHDALPTAVTLDSSDIVDITAGQATARWLPLGCRDDINAARVLLYDLLLTRYNSTDAVNVTVPYNVTQYTFDELMPDSSYTLSICAVSAAGRGPSSMQTFRTKRFPSPPYWIIAIGSVIAITTISGVSCVLLVSRFRRRCLPKVVITVPDPEKSSNTTNGATSSNNADNGRNSPVSTSSSSAVSGDYDSMPLLSASPKSTAIVYPMVHPAPSPVPSYHHALHADSSEGPVSRSSLSCEVPLPDDGRPSSGLTKAESIKDRVGSGTPFDASPLLIIDRGPPPSDTDDDSDSSDSYRCAIHNETDCFSSPGDIRLHDDDDADRPETDESHDAESMVSYFAVRSSDGDRADSTDNNRLTVSFIVDSAVIRLHAVTEDDVDGINDM